MLEYEYNTNELLHTSQQLGIMQQIKSKLESIKFMLTFFSNLSYLYMNTS